MVDLSNLPSVDFQGMTVSAATGSAVAAMLHQGTVMQKILRGISGTLVSYYLTPVVSPALEKFAEHWTGASLETASVTAATGFALGVSGMILINTIQKAAAALGHRADGYGKGTIQLPDQTKKDDDDADAKD